MAYEEVHFGQYRNRHSEKTISLGMILENVGCMSVVDMLLTGDSVGSLLLGVYMYVQETLDRRFLSISREMICTVHL